MRTFIILLMVKTKFLNAQEEPVHPIRTFTLGDFTRGGDLKDGQIDNLKALILKPL